MHIVLAGSHSRAHALAHPPDNPTGAIKLFERDQQTVSGELTGTFCSFSICLAVVKINLRATL